MYVITYANNVSYVNYVNRVYIDYINKLYHNLID